MHAFLHTSVMLECGANVSVFVLLQKTGVLLSLCHDQACMNGLSLC